MLGHRTSSPSNSYPHYPRELFGKLNSITGTSNCRNGSERLPLRFPTLETGAIPQLPHTSSRRNAQLSSGMCRDSAVELAMGWKAEESDFESR
jgi:hypothetical protein